MSTVINDFTDPLVDRYGVPTLGGGAKVLLDSIGPDDQRLTTWEACIWRPLNGELNTHRTASRNSASSRAIPITVTMKKVAGNPAYPTYWGSEQKGMQPGPELTGRDLEDAQTLIEDLLDYTLNSIEEYVKAHPIGDDAPEGAVRLHKSILNRYLEPWSWQRVLITIDTTDGAEGWMGFLEQRCTEWSEAAQPEFRECSDAMLATWRASEPQHLAYGQWHTPLIDQATREWCHSTGDEEEAEKFIRRISIARCARVSLLTHDRQRDYNEDLRMYSQTLRSSTPPHWSPFEHVAMPWHPNAVDHCVGNFPHWGQARHNLEYVD